MILSTVDIDCDSCMDRFVVGAGSIAEAKRMAKALGARAYRGKRGELCHECRLCRDCSENGHSMEGVSTGFAACKLCDMRRSTLGGLAIYRTHDGGRSAKVPKCPKAKPVTDDQATAV